MTQKAGLQFSVRRFQRKLKDMHLSGISRIRAGAPVYLTAALEFLMAELLQISVEILHKDSKKRKRWDENSKKYVCNLFSWIKHKKIQLYFFLGSHQGTWCVPSKETESLMSCWHRWSSLKLEGRRLCTRSFCSDEGSKCAVKILKANCYYCFELFITTCFQVPSFIVQC